MTTHWKPTTSPVGRARAVYEEKFKMEVKVDYTETYFLNSRKINNLNMSCIHLILTAWEK